MHSRLGKIVVRALVAGLALALGLLAAEVLIRRSDAFGISYYKDVNRYFTEAIRLVPEAIHEQGRLFENKPGVALSFVRFDWRTDAWGFRAGDAGEPFEPARDEPRSRLRLLFLGDSVTLAWGVDDGDSWIRRLEREGRAADGRALECLNAGHLSYDSVQEQDYLAAYGATLAPDAVVLTYVANDFESTWKQYEDFLQPGVGIQVPRATWRDRLWGWWVTRFRGIHGLWHLRAELAAQPEPGDAPVVVDEEVLLVEGWPRSEAALESMRARCAELGVPLVVLDHTMPRIRALTAWCERRGVLCYPLWFSDEELARDIRNSKADAHANELGQELLCAKALAALRAAGLLAP